MPSFQSFLNLHYSIPLPVRDPLRAFKYLKIHNTPTLRPLHSNPPQKVVPLLLPSQPSLASLSLRSPTSPDPPPSTLTEDPYSNSSEEPTILFQLRNKTILGPLTKIRDSTLIQIMAHQKEGGAAHPCFPKHNPGRA